MRSGNGTYTSCAHTSGELGSGTGLGFSLRVRMSLEASSSCRAEDALAVIEGADSSTLCLRPVVVRSAVLWDGGVIAEGDMFGCDRSVGTD